MNFAIQIQWQLEVFFFAAATFELPEAKVLFAGNKTFYFDVGSNRYGVFLRISELRANYRTAVTIPEHHWSRFRDILNELASKPEGNKLAEEKDGKAADEMSKNKAGENGGEQSDKKLKAAENPTPAALASEPTAIPVA